MAKEKELLADVARRLELSQKETSQRLKAFADEVDALLGEGNQVSFLGVGVIETRERTARETVNPATKERVAVPAKRVPAFRVSGSFKDKLKG